MRLFRLFTDQGVWPGLESTLDWNTCPGCRVCVPRGQVCTCPMRTAGPTVENQIRKTLVES